MRRKYAKCAKYVNRLCDEFLLYTKFCVDPLKHDDQSLKTGKKIRSQSFIKSISQSKALISVEQTVTEYNVRNQIKANSASM